MSNAVMMIGLPGSGKSTVVKNIKSYFQFLSDNYIVVSTDDEIMTMASSMGKTYSECFDSCIHAAKNEMNRKKSIAYKDHLDIVWDQTNLSAKTRNYKLRELSHHGYTVHACVIDCDIDILFKRLSYRSLHGKHIPSIKLEQMINIYEHPIHCEGFSTLVHIDTSPQIMDEWIIIATNNI